MEKNLKKNDSQAYLFACQSAFFYLLGNFVSVNLLFDYISMKRPQLVYLVCIYSYSALHISHFRSNSYFKHLIITFTVTFFLVIVDPTAHFTIFAFFAITAFFAVISIALIAFTFIILHSYLLKI